uniref:Vanillate monooxygenase n=1 Tax=Caulobacter sp. (strain K31) TaxID=366602 RepID=B0T3Q9_CAUSK
MSERYLQDAWYQAAFAREIGDKPLARTLLDVPIVLYRSAGKVVALHDRCPHRFAPLSMGALRDGQIICGYHGVGFGDDGRCVHNPHGALPRAMRVRAYPVVERHTVVWIWMGDTRKADPALIPDLSFIDETPETARICFYIPTAANYRLVVDNLMDLSHADYLHPTSLGGVMTGAEASTELAADGVVNTWINRNCLAPARFHARVPPPQRADAWTEATWRAPAIMVIGTALAPAGEPRRREDEIWALHSMTPETASTTHYFVCGTRGERLDDVEYSERLRGMLANAFINEDKPMLEAQQARMGGASLSSLRPVLLAVDAGAMQARAQLDRMIALEQDPSAPPARDVA